MCLGVPGKVTEIYEANGLRMGKVDFGGMTREACLEYLPDTEVGDYVIIHVGFAISQLSEKEAAETLTILKEIGDINAELGVTPTEEGQSVSPSLHADSRKGRQDSVPLPLTKGKGTGDGVESAAEPNR